MTKGYRAVLISPDGEDWVSDHGDSHSINEVWEKVSEQGSRWIFYPIVFVIHEPEKCFGSLRRIVDTPEGMEHLIGKSIRTTMRWIKDNPEFIQALFS